MSETGQVVVDGALTGRWRDSIESPARDLGRRFAARAAWAATAIALVSGCTGGNGTTGGEDGDTSRCTQVPTAVSSEKVDLLKSLANKFAAQWDGPGCVSVGVVSKSSGGTATALTAAWNETTEGMPAPVIWSPAASSWGTLVDHRLAAAGKPSIIPEDATSFMVTPLVVAMPKPMADALGYPKTPVGWSDILALSRDPKGWEAKGHPEWGPFKLGKTNPNYSTSGLSALVAQNYAAAKKTANLTTEDLQNPQTLTFNNGIESSVVHYGDITMTFLNNWYRADRRGTALTYASAVAVEEKSVIDYNLGNPDGVLSEGEEPRPPKVPLVAVYPTEGTLFSDNPLYVLDADWVTGEQREAAQKFTEFVQSEDNQRQVLKFGFRPGNPEVALGDPIVAANGVNPSEPETTLDVPQADVLAAMLDAWEKDRKEARVLIVLDVSGSMGEEANSSSGDTKLDLAKSAAIDALDQFKATDIVGLRTFTTDQDNKPLYRDLVELAPIGPNKERLTQTIGGLIPEAGTPLYEAAQKGFDSVATGFDPKRINAVVLLTDGRNDDGQPEDDRTQRDELLASLKSASDGEITKPVRIFTIAYGEDADQAGLRAVAEASNGAAYQATDPASIKKVFTAVVSNF